MYALQNDLYARTVLDDRRRDATRRHIRRTPRPAAEPWRTRIGDRLVRLAGGLDQLGRRLQPDATDCPSVCLESGGAR